MRSEYRTEPIDKIIQQIKKMQELNSTRNMAIYDPLFGLNFQRTQKICKILKNSNYSFIYETRADVLPPSLIPEIRDAGGEVMLLGLESVSMDTLFRMNKLANESQYDKYIQNAKKLIDISFKDGITPMLSIMLGYPEDTEKDLQITVVFLKKLIENYRRYYTDEKSGVGLIVNPHIVSIIPKSQLSHNLDEYKMKGLTISEGGLFRFIKVKNPSLNLEYSTVLNYINGAKMLSIITPTTINRMMRLVWCDLKKMSSINSDLIKNDFLLTKDVYQEYNEKLMNS